jgi:muconolactone delta-isomerase
MVEYTIGPSLEAVTQLEKQGKILAAGVMAGSKGSAMILNVADHNELSQVVQSLPFWSIMKVHVTPLQSFSERAGQERAAVAQLRGIQQRAPLNWW